MKTLLRQVILGSILTLATPAWSQPAPTTVPQFLQASELVNYHDVNENLHRSGSVSANAMKELAALGIKSILSLDDYSGSSVQAKKEADLAKAAGIAFTWYPMSGLAKPSVAKVEKALAFLNDNADVSVLVHCKHGSDRTGIVLAAYRMRHDGWDLDSAKAEMRKLGHSPFLYWWDSILEEFN